MAHVVDVEDPTVTEEMTGGPMSNWVVVPALEAFRHELNDVAPDRDKTSDGGIGDTSHAARPSGHNPDETGAPEDTDSDLVDEVRARDFDVDLNRPGLTMEMIAQYLVRQCRTGHIRWIKYIIFNRRIWKASNGWVQETYDGDNPHDKHMHVSCKPDTASENDTRPVGLASLVEDDVSAQDVITALNSEAGRAALSAWATSASGRTALGVAVGRSDTVPRLLGDGTWAPATDVNPTVGVASALSFIHKDLWLVKRDLGGIKGGVTQTNQNVVAVANRVGAAAEELSAFNLREAAEAPVSEERLVQLLDEAIPDHAGPLTPDEARAAVLDALRQAFTTGP